MSDAELRGAVRTAVDQLGLAGHFQAMSAKRGVLSGIASTVFGVEDAEKLEGLMEGLFEYRDLLDAARRSLTADFAEFDYGPALEQFSRASAVALFELEADAAGPEHKEELRAFLADPDALPSGRRLELLVHLDDATYSSVWMGSFQESLADGLEEVAGELVGTAGLTEADLAMLFEQLIAQRQQFVDERMGARFLAFAWREVELETLEDFAARSELPPIENLLLARARAFESATREACVEYAQRIAALVRVEH